jgi:hypothetical protein
MKIPSNEKIVVNYVCEGVKDYVATYHPLKCKYTLYKIMNEDYLKLKVAETPIDFDDIIEKERK